MDTLDLAILALRVGVVLILYAFLLVVLRSARQDLRPAPAAERVAEPVAVESPVSRRVSRGRQIQTPLRLSLVVVEPGSSGFATGARLEAVPGAIIGRGTDATLVLSDATVSGRHARLVALSGGLGVRDLGSTNGTYVNNTAIDTREAPLAPGDELRLGGVVLHVEAA